MNDIINADSNFETILNSMPYYIMVIDEDCNILFSNSYTQQNLDMTSKALSGAHCTRVMDGSAECSPDCPLEYRSIKEGSLDCEFYDEKSGEWLFSAVYPTDLKTASGKKVYIHKMHEITNRKLVEEDLFNNLERVRRVADSVVEVIARMVKSRDPYTSYQQEKVGVIVPKIAFAMGYEEGLPYGLRNAALLYDTGMIGIPSMILSKPAKLNKNEYELVKSHPIIGYEFLKDLDLKRPVAQIALQHHERLDGSGYPYGLKGDEILMETRIISVADVLEAMTSHRPYRAKHSVEEAIHELEKNAGLLYDKDVVRVTVNLIKTGEIVL